MGKRDNKANICIDCENFASCEWGRINPDTGKPNFQPVPGWDAEPTTLKVGVYGKKSVFVETYMIRKCPKFQKTEREIHGDD